MLTNEQAKQEAIKKAYGKHWEHVKHDINLRNGILTSGFFFREYSFSKCSHPSGIKFKEYDLDNKIGIMPISLIDLHKNNGWIRIEPDGSNLPTDDVDYKYYTKDEKCGTANLGGIKGLFKYAKITHYKPITPELKPIY